MKYEIEKYPKSGSAFFGNQVLKKNPKTLSIQSAWKTSMKDLKICISGVLHWKRVSVNYINIKSSGTAIYDGLVA